MTGGSYFPPTEGRLGGSEKILLQRARGSATEFAAYTDSRMSADEYGHRRRLLSLVMMAG